MSLPVALTKQDLITSAGCIGSRVYTDLGDDELYLIVPGRVLQKITDAVQLIAGANVKMIEYHRQQRKAYEAPV
jgi:uncharacterized protein (DUF169 family)